ncbi:MAG TPA: hypothetical protein VGM23_16105, partial [Armatimonadota bacterium]
MNRVFRIQPQALRWLVVLSVLLALGTTPVRADALVYYNFTVNNSGDIGGLSASCLTGGSCDLRSALQYALDHPENGYAISFASDMQIDLTSSLPQLAPTTNQLLINGQGHVIKINGQNTVANIFKINGNNVGILGLRVYGSGTLYSNIWISGTSKNAILANNVIGDSDPSDTCTDGSHS